MGYEYDFVYDWVAKKSRPKAAEGTAPGEEKKDEEPAPQWLRLIIFLIQFPL